MVRIITDANWRDELRPEYQTRPRQGQMGDLPFAAVYADAVPLIPEVEWPERVADMTAKKLWPEDAYQRFNPRLKYQDGLGYCWTYSLAQNLEVVRAINNLPYVELGPESLGGDVGWRNRGNYLDSALRYCAEHGMASREFIPDHEINPRNFKDGWEQDAQLYKPVEWWDGGAKDMWHEAVTMLLSGSCVPWIGLNWWSHAITYTRLEYVRGELCAYTPNSHGAGQDRILSGRKKVPDSLFSVRVMPMTGAAV
jgi:hypothetical protein